MIPATIYVAFGKSVNTLTTPYDPPQVILLKFYDPDTDHITIIDKPGHVTAKRVCASR